MKAYSVDLRERVVAVEDASGPALDAITPQDARHYFAHCGYGIAK